MKHINACWLKRIKCLRELLSELDVVKIKRGDIFLKLVDLTKELDGPNLLMDTILLSKEKLLEQLEALKVAWENEFSDSVEFSEEEVERWLVRYINKNDDIEDTLHQLSIDLRELENELFEIKTKHEIMVALMREYIEEWLTKSLVKITETDQQEASYNSYATSNTTTTIYKRCLNKQMKGSKISIAVSRVVTLFFPSPFFFFSQLSFFLFCSQQPVKPKADP
jgi:hypothetical protein